MTIENKYAFVKISLFGVGVKLCFIHIKSVVILFYYYYWRWDTFISNTCFSSTSNTQILTTRAPRSLQTKRILTISHNAYPDNLAPTEENHINRILLAFWHFLKLLCLGYNLMYGHSVYVYKNSHMIVVVISCSVYNLLCSSHNHITFK